MHTNKKGVSLMVSYALLVVIAIALSAFVYTYLQARLPEDRVQCPADLDVSIEFLQCNRADQSVAVQLQNRGLFNVTGIFLRFAEAGRSVRNQINEDQELFLKGDLDVSPLGPGQKTSILSYQVGSLKDLEADGTFILEAQPAVFKEGILVPCSNKIVTQAVECISTIIGWIFFEDPSEEPHCEGNWWDIFDAGCDKVYDGNWNTGGTAEPGNVVTYYVNYSTPEGAMFEDGLSNWTIEHGPQQAHIHKSIRSLGGFANPETSCWNKTKVQFKVEIDKTTIPQGSIQFSCKQNNGDWMSLYTKHEGGESDNLILYEEAMYWQQRS